MPEQILSNVLVAAGGWLVDRWGRAHRLGAHNTIGRSGDIIISTGSVSRKHAVLEARDGNWKLIDLGSRNGTFLNSTPVTGTVEIAHGDHLRFSTVRFVLASGLPFDPSGTPIDMGTCSLNEYLSRLDLGDGTMTWLKEVGLFEPPGGGVGFVKFRAGQCELTMMQYALIAMLLERAREEAGKAEILPGFVSSAELMVRLPWDTQTPEDSNLKHLIRRTRDRLEAIDLKIEARRGIGYRLQVSETDSPA